MIAPGSPGGHPAAVANDRRLRQRLLEAYEALPPLEQAVLQLLSVIFDGATKTPLANCIRRCELPLFKFKGFPQPGLGPVLDRLAREQLVTGSNHQWLCHPLVVEEITRRTVREGRFEI
ncbi:hypothetical protein RZS08_14945, partial [Arthrospira platensis SPKY1]|nr:hypothetical protein [Arthrospira platensis SPKY1]